MYDVYNAAYTKNFVNGPGQSWMNSPIKFSTHSDTREKLKNLK